MNQRSRYRANPLAMGTPEKIAIGIALAGGAAAGIYYMTRPASAAPVLTPAPGGATGPAGPSGPTGFGPGNGTGGGGSAGATGAAGGGAGATGPVYGPMPGGGYTITGPKENAAATSADSGQTFNVTVGSTFSVTLPVNAPITSYTGSDSGSSLSLTSSNQAGGNQFDVWTANAAGTDTITYAPVGGLGTSYTFTVVVAPAGP